MVFSLGTWGGQEDEYMKRPEIKITIPDTLKVQLVDDWEAVTKNNQVSQGACHVEFASKR